MFEGHQTLDSGFENTEPIVVENLGLHNSIGGASSQHHIARTFDCMRSTGSTGNKPQDMSNFSNGDPYSLIFKSQQTR